LSTISFLSRLKYILNQKKEKILRIIYPVRGIAALEATLTLPTLCSLIFFLIELIRIDITKSALNIICAKITFQTIGHNGDGPSLIQAIDEIIETHRPRFAPTSIFRYYFEVYLSLAEMCSTAPYGGTCVHHNSSDSAQFIPSGAQHWHPHVDNSATCLDNLAGNGFPAGRVFVLTVSCAYPFSNVFVKKLFSGGSNSRICTKSENSIGDVGATSSFSLGNLYLLWARGVGIVN
jgi:hypothetical protein